MKIPTSLLVRSATIAIAATCASQAHAQDVGQAPEPQGESTAPTMAAPTPTEAQGIVVTGIRASLASAQARKREADAVVDSIVAEDIGKLPDINTTEALQRVSGVQVSRDVGEGGSVAIRGLSQVLTTVNGRVALFSLQDVPAELLSGIDVYKTPTADLIEGGIGGVIDLRTRRPLDFDGFELSGSARARYSDLADDIQPMVTLLASNRWDVGEGEMGLLLSGAYQRRSYRQDLLSVGVPAPRTDLIAGEEVIAPNGDYELGVRGLRTRLGLDGMFQWKPNPDLEFYLQGSYVKLKTEQDQFALYNQSLGVPVVPGSVSVFEGTNDFATGTFVDLPFRTFGVARDLDDESQQYAAGTRWESDMARVSGEVSYSTATDALYYSELDLAAVAPEATLDLTGDIPGIQFSGVDLTNLGSYNVGPLTRSENHTDNELWAGRVDAEILVDSSFLRGFRVGTRYSMESQDFIPIRFYQAPSSTLAATDYADLYQAVPINDTFDNSSSLQHDYLVSIPDLLRDDFEAVRERLGITQAPAISEASVYDINQQTLAAYGMVLIDTDIGLPVDGNIGVRVVETDLEVGGNRNVGGVLTPITRSNAYTSVLPSANLRVHLGDELQLRLSASQTLTRPTFSQLSPAMTLVPGQGAGTSGNPELEPLRADQLDASLEWYPTSTTSMYLAGFYRKVKGFVFTTVTPNVVIDGISYNITQPNNGEDGTIRGLEIGGQTFLDFLPAPFDGLGLQGNYTFVDSETPSAIEGYTTPLPQLSKHSFNISGIYETGPISARIAYNYRSRFFQSVYAGSGSVGASPIYAKGYGWLDASINYDLTDRVTVSLEGSNLTRTEIFSYYTVETRPNSYAIDDIQVLAGVRFSL